LRAHSAQYAQYFFHVNPPIKKNDKTATETHAQRPITAGFPPWRNNDFMSVPRPIAAIAIVIKNLAAVPENAAIPAEISPAV
jgi:hypothetical protein